MNPIPSPEILGLGCVAVDDLLFVERYPPADTKVPISRRLRQVGGLTGCALVAAARLGSRCAFAGVLGEDEASKYVLDFLRAEGIDVGQVRCRAGARPVASTIVVGEQDGARNIFFDKRGVQGAAPDHPGESFIRGCRVLLVDHYGVEGMTRAARIALAAGVPVVSDIEGLGPAFAELLALPDHLVVSEDFAVAATGSSDPATALKGLWHDRRDTAVVTCGRRGCYYLSGAGGPWHLPAFAIEAADTTGCGDVFHGAYASALARGQGLAERIRFASAAAALRASRAAIPYRAEVEQFLRDPPGTLS
jgi:sugar/nucleoside kinase (ribokinase family)